MPWFGPLLQEMRFRRSSLQDHQPLEECSPGASRSEDLRAQLDALVPARQQLQYDIEEGELALNDLLQQVSRLSNRLDLLHQQCAHTMGQEMELREELRQAEARRLLKQICQDKRHANLEERQVEASLDIGAVNEEGSLAAAALEIASKSDLVAASVDRLVDEIGEEVITPDGFVLCGGTIRDIDAGGGGAAAENRGFVPAGACIAPCTQPHSGPEVSDEDANKDGAEAGCGGPQLLSRGFFGLAARWASGDRSDTEDDPFLLRDLSVAADSPDAQATECHSCEETH